MDTQHHEPARREPPPEAVESPAPAPSERPKPWRVFATFAGEWPILTTEGLAE